MQNRKETKDKIQDLFDFLDANKDVREGDFWNYSVNPEIVSYINTFDEVDGENLTLAINMWDEQTRYNIADALLNIDNQFIDGKGLYTEIFLKSNNADYYQYLVQNIHVTNDDGVRKFDLYERVLAKICSIEKESNTDYSYYKQEIQNKINSFNKSKPDCR